MASALVADWVISHQYVSVTNVRKICTTFGAVSPGIFLILASYAECEVVPVIIHFILAMGLMGFYYPGMKVNIIDISPNYSHGVMGLSNGVGALIGFVAPYVAAAMTPHVTE